MVMVVLWNRTWKASDMNITSYECVWLPEMKETLFLEQEVTESQLMLDKCTDA